MRRLLDARYGQEHGYDYAYLYPGMQKVVQAAGRVIRTEHDSGTVHLIDDRYRRARARCCRPGGRCAERGWPGTLRSVVRPSSGAAWPAATRPAAGWDRGSAGSRTRGCAPCAAPSASLRRPSGGCSAAVVWPNRASQRSNKAALRLGMATCGHGHAGKAPRAQQHGRPEIRQPRQVLVPVVDHAVEHRSQERVGPDLAIEGLDQVPDIVFSAEGRRVQDRLRAEVKAGDLRARHSGPA